MIGKIMNANMNNVIIADDDEDDDDDDNDEDDGINDDDHGTDEILHYLREIRLERAKKFRSSVSLLHEAENQLNYINSNIDTIEFCFTLQEQQDWPEILDNLKEILPDAEAYHVDCTVDTEMKSFKYDRATYVYKWYRKMKRTDKLQDELQTLRYWIQELQNDGKDDCEIADLEWDFTHNDLECTLDFPAATVGFIDESGPTIGCPSEYQESTEIEIGHVNEHPIETNGRLDNELEKEFGNNLDTHNRPHVMMNINAFSFKTLNVLEVKVVFWDLIALYYKTRIIYDRGKFIFKYSHNSW